MYLTAPYIEEAVQVLDSVHPFWGTSFLAFKRLRLPIEKPVVVDIAGTEAEILSSYYNPRPESAFYYVPLRGTGPKERWVRKSKYPTSGLQAMRTQTFKDVLMHPKVDEWCWKADYIKELRRFIDQRQHGLLPRLFFIAVWLYRDVDWPESTKPQDLVTRFINEFHISRAELKTLFDDSPAISKAVPLFQTLSLSKAELSNIIGRPSDAPPDKGGTLSYLETRGIGPAEDLVFEPGDRLNLITGDNGLGKTFLLDVAWWALANDWAGLPAYPNPETRDAEIILQIKSEGHPKEKTTVGFDWSVQKWQSRAETTTIPGLLVYARVDGSFAVKDPTSDHSLLFNRERVWDGYEKSINGLVRDWVSWQRRDDQSAFETLCKVLARLSPPETSDLGVLIPGKPTRIPKDAREIPTIHHPYGDIPILYISAGIRRIITIAYLVVWAWEEHRIRAEIQKSDLERRMVILVDEIEAHLHPQWQRVILPALMHVQELLSSDLQLQLIVSTHSPLVTASIEPVFDEKQDDLFHLDLVPNNLLTKTAELKKIEFVKQGSIDAWLTSEAFGLRQSSSRQAEQALERAKDLQKQDAVTKEEVQAVSDALIKHLAPHHDFWPRWLSFAEKHGVHL